MRLDFYSFSFLAILSFNISIAVVFRFSNLVCKSYNETRLVYNECRLKAVSRDRVVMNVNGTISSSINHIKVHVRIFKRESGFKPWLFNFKFDGCRFLQNNNVAAAKFLYPFFKDFSNLNHTCPYKGHVYIAGCYPRPELLVLPFPSGEYMVAIRLFFDGMLQSDVNITFVYVEDITTGK